MMRVIIPTRRQAQMRAADQRHAQRRRKRLQIWVDPRTHDVVTALAAQRRQSNSRVAAALIASALGDLTHG